MNEFLIVRLSNRDEAKCQWLAWSESEQQVIGSGEIGSLLSLDDIKTYASGRQVIVLLNSADTFLTRVEIPAGSQRQFESMLPYLVEDDLAQDVDELHFTVLKKQGNFADICAVERVWLDKILNAFSHAGLEVKKIMPDVLALPPVDNQISALEIDGQWLLRKPDFQGLTVPKDWLELIASSDWVKEQDEFLPLTAHTPLPELALDPDQVWKQGEPILVMQLLSMGALKQKTNLLTGKYKASSSLTKYWTIWRSSVAAGVVFISILMSYQWLQIQSLERQAETYRAESERIFRTVVNKQRIPTVSYLKREMQREESRLSGGNSEGSLFNWLAGLPQALKDAPGLDLTNLTFDAKREEVRLQAQSKDFETFNKAKSALEKSFAVEQGQLNRSGQIVKGSFILKRKDGEVSQ